MTLLKDRIHAKLLALAAAGPYYPVTYDPDTGLPTVDNTSPISAASALANEVKSTFGLAARNRQGYVLERKSWEWLLLLEFNQEATVEPMEQAIRATIPVVPRLDGLPQAWLMLESVIYEHPTTQSTASGTRIRLSFSADLSPA